MTDVLSVEQLVGFKRIRGARYQNHRAMREDVRSWPGRDYYFVLGMVGGGHGMFVARYLDSGRWITALAEYPQLAVIDSVEYLDLEASAELAACPALTVEESRALSNADRERRKAEDEAR